MKEPQETSAEQEESGRWPHPLLQFLWDLLPARLAPENSGLRAPAYREPEYFATELPKDERHRQMLVDVARRSSQAAHDRVHHAESRAARMVNVTLTLFGVALALVAYQFTQADSTTAWALRSLTLAGTTALALAGIEALEVDRVGLTDPPTAAQVAAGTDYVESYIRAEDHDRQVVEWTAKNKLTQLLQARAWFSRGILLLLVSAALTAVFLPPSFGQSEEDQPRDQVTPSSTVMLAGPPTGRPASRPPPA
ncbi:MAG: hypothetical protein ACREA0_04205 [bacterium]